MNVYALLKYKHYCGKGIVWSSSWDTNIISPLALNLSYPKWRILNIERIKYYKFRIIRIHVKLRLFFFFFAPRKTKTVAICFLNWNLYIHWTSAHGTVKGALDCNIEVVDSSHFTNAFDLDYRQLVLFICVVCNLFIYFIGNKKIFY